MSEQYILRMEGIKKAFPGVQALNGVSFYLKPGEIHALMGANGAGKSTLMKVLVGVFAPDEGEIYLNDKPVHIKSIAQAHAMGVNMVFQELNILPHLSVLENIFLSNETTHAGFYDWKSMRKRAQEILDSIELDVDLDAQVRTLSPAKQQMVEIARALATETKIIIFDEPTSSLTIKEVEQLYKIMGDLKKRGIAMVYISHRLEEIYRICERLTLMRDGEWVFTDEIANISNERLVSGIIGRKAEEQYPAHTPHIGETIFEAQNITSHGRFEDVSFQVRKGEILGFAGLAGAGRTEIAKTIFGIYPLHKGEMYLNGKQISPKSPAKAVKNGIAYVSEDRKIEGILPVRSVRENTALSSLSSRMRGPFINKKAEIASVSKQIDALHTKTPSIEQQIQSLSGGNQQKVCLARWLLTKPKLLILDEPTRGIDVGAKAEFYDIIVSLAQQDVGVIVISSEEAELIGICDRIIVMRNHHKVGEVIPNQTSDIKEEMVRMMLEID
ncbi:MAG: sugar ABC transporter ATP-binding protein [Oscillospiraceae bacterium]|nr:sugar ABC transporter ATP-binding protein [Oscillospiraceae bacterium]